LRTFLLAIYFALNVLAIGIELELSKVPVLEFLNKLWGIGNRVGIRLWYRLARLRSLLDLKGNKFWRTISQRIFISFSLPVGVPGEPPGLLQHRNPGNHLQNLCFYHKKSSK
jgi:hypothetical protein